MGGYWASDGHLAGAVHLATASSDLTAGRSGPGACGALGRRAALLGLPARARRAVRRERASGARAGTVQVRRLIPQLSHT